MSPLPNWFRPADRTSQNESDGKIFYGYDDKDSGRTDWYDENGNLDSYTDTPYDEDDED